MPVRVPVVLLVLALGLTGGLLALGLAGGTAARRPDPQPGVAPAPLAQAAATQLGPRRSGALAVLHGWDARRSAAWARGDEAALSRLYAASSGAGVADVALLRRYRARGLVVQGLRMQVLRVRVLTARPRLVALEVTDRLASAFAAPLAGGPGRRLPADSASTHHVVLRRVGNRWVMWRVLAVATSTAGGR